ncbi:hypothetical protein [Cupriavidus sp. CP313]
MEPDELIRTFEEMATDDDVELSLDGAISGLAVLLTDLAIQGRRGRC